ncbi:hypothetical protein RGR602_CH00649 [Rhizobium gallicum bv. gallicum R602sp]|uniref:Uncharacterized protein n=1 Tax=Rhizobium gallicum bv. gallicum R602sp TaxID=1041138 RepID=A0A0B4X0G1_9HYPH|nr:hypothetical protein RGR602_CH00649 [Rhizobium gallicum bv. gallicum R602sp]
MPPAHSERPSALSAGGSAQLFAKSHPNRSAQAKPVRSPRHEFGKRIHRRAGIAAIHVRNGAEIALWTRVDDLECVSRRCAVPFAAAEPVSRNRLVSFSSFFVASSLVSRAPKALLW